MSWMHTLAPLPVKRALQTQHQPTAHAANEIEDDMQKHQIMQAVPESARAEIGGATDLNIFAGYVNLIIHV